MLFCVQFKNHGAVVGQILGYRQSRVHKGAAVQPKHIGRHGVYGIGVKALKPYVLPAGVRRGALNGEYRKRLLSVGGYKLLAAVIAFKRAYYSVKAAVVNQRLCFFVQPYLLADLRKLG